MKSFNYVENNQLVIEIPLDEILSLSLIPAKRIPHTIGNISDTKKAGQYLADKLSRNTEKIGELKVSKLAMVILELLQDATFNEEEFLTPKQ